MKAIILRVLRLGELILRLSRSRFTPKTAGTIRGIAHLLLLDLALSDSEGNLLTSVVTNPAYSGFRERRYDQPNEQVQEIAVKTNLLDNMIPEHGCASLRFRGR